MAKQTKRGAGELREPAFRCDQCGQVCASQGLLNQHKLLNHYKKESH